MGVGQTDRAGLGAVRAGWACRQVGAALLPAMLKLKKRVLLGPCLTGSELPAHARGLPLAATLVAALLVLIFDSAGLGRSILPTLYLRRHREVGVGGVGWAAGGPRQLRQHLWLI